MHLEVGEPQPNWNRGLESGCPGFEPQLSQLPKSLRSLLADLRSIFVFFFHLKERSIFLWDGWLTRLSKLSSSQSGGEGNWLSWDLNPEQPDSSPVFHFSGGDLEHTRRCGFPICNTENNNNTSQGYREI